MINLRKISVKHQQGKNTAVVPFEHKGISYIAEAEHTDVTVQVIVKSEGKELYKTLNNSREYTISQAVNKTVNELLYLEGTQGRNRKTFLNWIKRL